MVERVLHRVVLDRGGEVAGRIVSILEAKGYMEAESVADGAMVPAKDVREGFVVCVYWDVYGCIIWCLGYINVSIYLSLNLLLLSIVLS